MAKEKSLYKNGHFFKSEDFFEEELQKTSNYGLFYNSLIKEYRIYDIENERLNNFDRLQFISYKIKKDNSESIDTYFSFDDVLKMIESKQIQSFKVSQLESIQENKKVVENKVIKELVFDKSKDPMLEPARIIYKSINPNNPDLYDENDFLSHLTCIKLWYQSLGTKVGWGWFLKKDTKNSFVVKKIGFTEYGIAWKDSDENSFYCYAYLKEEFEELNIAGLSQYMAENFSHELHQKYFQIAVEKMRQKWNQSGYNPLLKQPFSLRKSIENKLNHLMRTMYFLDSDLSVQKETFFFDKEKNLNFSKLEYLFKNDKISFSDIKNLFDERNHVIENKWNSFLNNLKDKGYLDFVKMKEDEEFIFTNAYKRNMLQEYKKYSKLNIISQHNDYHLVEIKKGIKVWCPNKALDNLKMIKSVDFRPELKDELSGEVDYSSFLFDGRKDVFSAQKIEEFVNSTNWKKFVDKFYQTQLQFTELNYKLVGDIIYVSFSYKPEEKNTVSLTMIPINKNDIFNVVNSLIYIKHFVKKETWEEVPIGVFLKKWKEHHFSSKSINDYIEGKDNTYISMLLSIDGFVKDKIPLELVKKEIEKISIIMTETKFYETEETNKENWTTPQQEQIETPEEVFSFETNEEEKEQIEDSVLLPEDSFSLNEITNILSVVSEDEESNYLELVSRNYFDMVFIEEPQRIKKEDFFKFLKIPQENGNVFFIFKNNEEFVKNQELFTKDIKTFFHVKNEIILANKTENYIVYWCHLGGNVLSDYFFSQKGENIQIDSYETRLGTPIVPIKKIIELLGASSYNAFVYKPITFNIIKSCMESKLNWVSFVNSRDTAFDFLNNCNKTHIPIINSKNNQSSLW